MKPNPHKSLTKHLRHARRRESLGFEHLEQRRLLASDYCNAFNALDVDDDGFVLPQDALAVINELNTLGP